MSRKLTINQRYQVNGLEVEAQLDPNGSPARVVLWVQAGSNALGFHRLEAQKGPEGWGLFDGEHPQKEALQTWLDHNGPTLCDGLY